jgi:hypothetical protein
MMDWYIKRIIIVVLVIFYPILFPLPVDASSQAGSEIYFKPEEIIKFAKKVEKSLAEKGARVALLARVGRPRNQLPPGFGYTHSSFAVYSIIMAADGRKMPGYSIYNLYQRDKEPDVSDLIQDFPADFFAGVQVLEAGVIIPSPEVQRRLLKVITSSIYKKLHNPRYSVIANPFALDYQNCTEHTLDILFAAIYETDNIRQIKKNEEAYFKPQPVNVNPVKLALGSLFSAEIKLSDHPGQPVTATFETIGRFLQKYDAGSVVYEIKAED